MESMLEMQIGGFLDRLENDFGIISKVRPILSKPNTRSVKFKMNDNFLSFWFRFIIFKTLEIDINDSRVIPPNTCINL